MRRALISFMLLALAAPLASADDQEFQAIVRGVEARLGVHRIHIPLFGLATFFVRVAHPRGVHRLDMAMFENPATTPDDSLWFDDVMRTTADRRWSTMIRVEDRRKGEVTYICARPDGNNWKMILATFDPHDAVILNLKVKPDVLVASLAEPRDARHCLNSDRGK
jgi:hypothetical protein